MRCEFSLDHYLDCLALASDQGYKLAPVADYMKWKDKDKLLLLRHDVDLSLDFAYQMASAECKNGYQSTYYVLLHSPSFSALSPKGMEMIRAISGQGHEIGLQVDSRYMIPSEHYILKDITGKLLRSYAQHFPSITPLHHRMTGFIDSRDIPIRYISDSGRNWRAGCLCQHIGKIKKLQVLTHPIWWCSDSLTREAALEALMRDRMSETIQSVNDFKEIVTTYIRDEIGNGGDSEVDPSGNRWSGIRVQT